MKDDNSMDMLHGPLLRNIIWLAVPIMLSSILQQLLNTADIAVAGHFESDLAMAAIGSNAPVINLFVTLLSGLSIGANVLIALGIGRRKLDDVRTGVQVSMSFAVVFGLCMVLLGLWISHPILSVMGTPEDVIELADLYLRIYCLGLPFIMVYNFGSAILRADGDSRRPLYCLILACATNLVLDLAFVLVLGWGLAGVAWATTIANGLSAVLITAFMVREKGYLHFDCRSFSLERKAVRKIIVIGGPAGLQGIVFSLSNIIIQAAINSFGSDAVAGVSAAANFEFLTYYIVNGFVQAAVTFTSQNYAAGEFARCRKVFSYSLAAALVFTAAASALCIWKRYPLLHIFTESEAVMAYALIRMCIGTTFEFMTALYEVPGGCLRGMGVSMLPTLETLFGSCLLRIAFILTVFRACPDFTLLTAIYPISWAVTGALVLGTYFWFRKTHFVR